MKKIIAFSGKMCAGKTTISLKLNEYEGFLVISIGSMIKKVTNLLIENPLTLSKYIQMMFAKEEDPTGIFKTLLETYEKDYRDGTFITDQAGIYIKNQDYRSLVQFVATTFREISGDDVWVRLLSKEAQLLVKEGRKVICDDLRYPSEKKVFEEFGFHTIRLDIDPTEQKKRIQQLYGNLNEELLFHETEIALDTSIFDLRFDNSTLTVEEACEKVLDYIKG